MSSVTFGNTCVWEAHGEWPTQCGDDTCTITGFGVPNLPQFEQLPSLDMIIVGSMLNLGWKKENYGKWMVLIQLCDGLNVMEYEHLYSKPL